MQVRILQVQSHHPGVPLQLQTVVTVACLCDFRFPLVELLYFKALNILQEGLTFILHVLQVLDILEELGTVKDNSVHLVMDLPRPDYVAQKGRKVLYPDDILFPRNRLQGLSSSAFILVLQDVEIVLNKFKDRFLILESVILDRLNIQ